MSPMTVFFAAGDEFPHATANTTEITNNANSFPNVRFISMPLLASFRCLLQFRLHCFSERFIARLLRASCRAASPDARHLPFAASVRLNCSRGPRGLRPFEEAIAHNASLYEGVLCPGDELEERRPFRQDRADQMLVHLHHVSGMRNTLKPLPAAC